MLQTDVRLPGTTDESNGTWSGPKRPDGFFFSGNNVGIERQPEIIVRVHPQERFFTVSGKQIPGAAAAARRQELPYDPFVTLASAGGFELRDMV
jgi:hypothetical protein